MLICNRGLSKSVSGSSDCVTSPQTCHRLEGVFAVDGAGISRENLTARLQRGCDAFLSVTIATNKVGLRRSHLPRLPYLDLPAYFENSCV